MKVRRITKEGGMKKQYYGVAALLVRCGSYIYNVTSEPNLYYNAK